jgi:hypothetical protein
MAKGQMRSNKEARKPKKVKKPDMSNRPGSAVGKAFDAH